MPKRTDAVDDAMRSLYAEPPEQFTARRTELVAEARRSGDAAAAQAIGKLRKPTQAAWIVNAFVLDDPSVVDQLSALGDRLRQAQDALDAGTMRELTGERRALVATLTKGALARAGRGDQTAGLRDEVSGTFDAAIADPEVAERLGRLPRSEQWSGFGFVASGSPELTLVRGGRDRARTSARGGRAGTTSSPATPSEAESASSGPTTAAKTKTKAPPRPSAAERRRQERALKAARDAFEKADAAFDKAQDAEEQLSRQVRKLAGKLSDLQDQLDAARRELETARKEVTTSRAERRTARSALDRVEREADR